MNEWLIQHCSADGCDVAIRVHVGHQSPNPRCKWHQSGTTYTANPRPGMPNPELPWPWQTDAERERRLKLPYWVERFKQYGYPRAERRTITESGV